MVGSVGMVTGLIVRIEKAVDQLVDVLSSSAASDIFLLQRYEVLWTVRWLSHVEAAVRSARERAKHLVYPGSFPGDLQHERPVFDYPHTKVVRY
jgi:hypothetical protein